MVTAKQQAENDIRQAKLLSELLDQLAKHLGTLDKSAIHLAEVFRKTGQETLRKEKDIDYKDRHDKRIQRGYNKDREFKEEHDNKVQEGYDKEREFLTWKINMQGRAKFLEEKFQREKQAEDGRQKDSRARNRIEVERVHGENVRHNLKMRSLYKDQSESFGKVMSMMTGMTGKGAAMGGVSKLYNTLTLGSGVLDISGKLRLAKSELADYQEMDDGSEQSKGWLKLFGDKVLRLTAVQAEMREKMGIFGGFGGKGDEDSKWARRLEPFIAFAKKNKDGIIISAVSIGMMFMVFKKLLSVSPMLQKMLEVMGLAFNLILRPFGDFLGFILRPIAMGFLTMVMPFFQMAYPILMELGTTIGNALANWDLQGAVTAILDTFPPFQMIEAIAAKLGLVDPVSEETDDKSNIVLTGAALLAAGGGLLSAPYVGYRATKFGIGKIGGLFKGAPPSGTAGVFSGLGGGGNPSDGNPSSKDPNWRYYKGVEKVSKMARMMSILSKIARIANPVGLALLGWGGITSVIKHVDPDLYQTMRDSTEFMGVGREFLGLGEQSDAEQLVGGYNWVKDSLGINNSILDNSASISNNGSNFNGIATPTANGGTNITFNIDKVEKGVDINMIAMAVKSVLETSNTRIVS